MSKPLAKSLHTITVIAQIANATRQTGAADSVEMAVYSALAMLELTNKPDVYGLAAKAARLVR